MMKYTIKILLNKKRKDKVNYNFSLDFAKFI